jgi:phosphate transport system substrate-binding protein
MRRSNSVALAAVLLALAAPASANAVTLIGSGSTAAQPYFLALFQAYKKVQPSVNFIYTADGGNSGVKDVQQGKSQFAGQSRPPLPSDAGTTYVKLFLDGLCLVVNPQNKLQNITIQQTSDVYTGVLTNWGQLGASGLSTTIDPVGRDTNGGTFNFFSTAVLNGASQASNVNALGSDGLVANAVANDPNAIGYDGLAYQKGHGTRALALNGVACDAAHVKSQAYPLSRFLFLVLPTASPDANVQAFADWVRTSATAGQVISAEGGVPAFNQAVPHKAKKKKKHKKTKRKH